MFKQPVILFDGYCNLCSWWVQFVLRHDRKKHFRFCALQSAAAEKLLTGFNILEKNKSVVLLSEGKILTKSTAALTIFKKLSGCWSFLYAFIIVPLFIRDAIYDFIAKHRYQLFGKRNQCYAALEEDQERFQINR